MFGLERELLPNNPPVFEASAFCSCCVPLSPVRAGGVSFFNASICCCCCSIVPAWSCAVFSSLSSLFVTSSAKAEEANRQKARQVKIYDAICIIPPDMVHC